MAIEKTSDGKYSVGGRTFNTADEAIAFDAGQNAPPPGPRAPAYQMPNETPSSGFSLWWLVLIIPVALFLLMLVIGAMAGPPSERSQARSAIDLCWTEQKRKSFDPGTQRFIAGTCEMMEREFQKKYGVAP